MRRKIMTHNAFLKGMGATSPSVQPVRGKLPTKAEVIAARWRTSATDIMVDKKSHIICGQCGNTKAEAEANGHPHQHSWIKYNPNA